MKKSPIFKRILALVLGVVLCLGALPMPQVSAAPVVVSGSCGENLTWTLDTAGKLTISGTGAMIDYTSVALISPFYNDSRIRSVEIKNGVTSIGDYAFYWCESLTSLTIPDGITSIGDGAFYMCSSLTSITIPGSVTSIGHFAFSSCDSLTSISIPDSVISICENAFYECVNLTAITVDPDNWVFMSENGVLFDKPQKTLLHYPAAKTESSYIVPSSVTTIGDYAFEYCTNLTDIVLPDGLTSIGIYAFRSCDSLTSISIPDSVTSIDHCAFEYCTSLTGIELPDGLPSIGSRAFYDCTNLTSISIPDSVTSIGDNAFAFCESLTNIDLPDNLTSIGYYAFSSCDSLTSITIPDGVTSIGKWAFRGCGNLTSIDLPDSLTTIGDSVFNDCYGLTAITVDPDNGVFMSENGILFDKPQETLLCYPAAKTESAYAIPSGVTSIGAYAFEYCTNLTDIVLPDGLTSIGIYAFRSCDSLTSISIPDSVTSIGDGAFNGCSNLTNITIPDGVTSIGYSTFSTCANLTSIIIPDSVTSIGDSAFFHSDRLKDVYYTGSQTDWEAITVGDYNDPLLNATVHYAVLPTVAIPLDVSYFRSGETYTAPSKEGYVFAGWYVDAAMTVPLGEDVTTGTAYAKFVDEDVLSVKWQLSSGTTADSAKTALRVLTTVDGLSYSRVGFTVEAPGKATKELTSKTVYEIIYGYTGSNNESYKPTIFAHTSKYFMAHTLSGIPQSDFNKEIKVTPKWTTLDGTEVTGKPLTIRIIDAIGG